MFDLVRVTLLIAVASFALPALATDDTPPATPPTTTTGVAPPSDQPAINPAVVPDATKPDVPKTDAPMVAAPKVDAPKMDAPKKLVEPLKLDPKITVGITNYLWAFVDLDNPSTYGVIIYSLLLSGKAEIDDFSFYSEIRYRNDKFRSFSPSNVWIQSAWAGWKTPVTGLSLKAGLLYDQSGIFWDDSFFGNAYYSNGLKLDNDFNLEANYSNKMGDLLDLNAWVQLSPAEDGLNGSFDPGQDDKKLLLPRDLETTPGFHQEVAGRVRVVPTFHLGPVDLSVGASGQAALYKRDNADPTGNATHGNRLMGGGELDATVGPVRVFAEADDELLSNFTSAPVNRVYGLAGAEWKAFKQEGAWLPSITFGFSENVADYQTEKFLEYTTTARVVVQVHSNVGVIGEYALWRYDYLGKSVFNWANLVLYYNY